MLKTAQKVAFGRPDITESEIQAVTDVMRSGWLGTGAVATEFEREFSEHMGGLHCVAVNSCTMGLMVSLRALGVKAGDEVITTPLTFAATVNAIMAVGAVPVFADTDENGLLDPQKVEEKITKRTRAIIPVHYTGAPCDMEAFDAIAILHRIPVIEDAAHAFGGFHVPRHATVNSASARRLGSLGDVGVFSFYPTKNITSGDGGMLVTGRADIAESARVLANQGQTANAWSRYGHGPVRAGQIAANGYKGSLPDVLAAIGLSQLRRWPELRDARKALWLRYERELGNKAPGHSRHLYTILEKNRDSFRTRLKDHGILTGVHYNPLHLEPAFEWLGYMSGDFPNAERIGAETISLPLSTTMTEDEVMTVIETVKELRNA